MLKKAGIVVATAAAGLLAVSPLAFAGDKGYDVKDGNHNGGGDTTINKKFIGEINDIDQTGDGGNNACSNENNGDSTGALLGIGSLLNNTNVLQCVNLLNNNLNDNTVQVNVLGSGVVDETS